MPTLTPNRRTLLFCLGLMAVTVAAYWPVNRAQFIAMDDHAYVSDNEVVQAGLTTNGLEWAFSAVRVANYHPLTWLSHMLDCELFGANPHWHHRINLLLHCLNSVLLFLVIRRMTGREGCAAFVACVFALHPQHVESVAWISERKDVLSGLFFILTLGCYARYVEQRTWTRYALALLMFALGLLSKPMLVTLPCVLLLLDVWPLRRTTLLRGGDPSPQPLWISLRPLLVEKIPFFLLAAGACAATVFAQSRGGAVLTTEQVPLSMRFGNAMVSYVLYVRKALWPTDLAGFYPLLRPWPMTQVLGAIAVLLVVTAAAVVLWRRKPYLAVGWLWFIGMLVPVIGFVQVGNQSMADRYSYLPMIGLTLIVAWGISELLPWRAWQYALGAIALAGCVWITADDVKYWQTSELLFTRALERTERNVFALHNLASSQLSSGKHDQAIRNFQECARLQPGNPHVRRALGYAYLAAKRHEQAIAQMRLALQLDPDDGRTWDAMGHVFVEQGNWPEAARHFRTAVQLKPDDYDAWINLAVATREIDEAKHAIERASAINPRVAKPWYMLGRLLRESGQSAAAIEPLRRAIAIEPTHDDAHYQLGLALMSSGHGADAANVLMAALQRKPNSPHVLTKLAWLLATHPDARLRHGDDAVFLASRANALTDARDPHALDALAAAQAELGQFDQATETAAKAARLARDAGDVKLADQIESRAAQYRTRSAVRDSTLANTDAGGLLP